LHPDSTPSLNITAKELLLRSGDGANVRHSFQIQQGEKRLLNSHLPNYIESIFQMIATPLRPHPTGASIGTGESSDLINQYLHEAELSPPFNVETFRQYWATPYDNFFLDLKFPEAFAFKKADILALSPKSDLTFDELKAASESEVQQLVLDMIQPFDLKDNSWLTSVTEMAARSVSDGTLYLHYFYGSKNPVGGGVLRRHLHRTIVHPSAQLAELENPNNVRGVAQVPHPRVSSQQRLQSKIPVVTDAATAQLSAGASLPYKRLFITLAANEVTWSPIYHLHACINVEMARTPDKNDYIALADHYPKNAKDYIGYYYWQKVEDLGPGGYVTDKWCKLDVNDSLHIADFKTLESLYLFYAGWVDGAWKIIGEPVQFKGQKHWMEESLINIGQKRLHEIAIPGSHDAGSFDMYAKMFTLNGWAHNMDFPGQLELGMRYFDCRLQNFPSKNPPFYFYHGGAMTYTTITDLISALKDFFLKDKSTDIVILDFTHFDGFERNTQKDDYAKLFDYFKNDDFFSHALMTPDEARDLTISELRSLGRRLYIGCIDAQARTDFNLGKDISLTEQWANTHDVGYLWSFLDNQVRDHTFSQELWSLQAILTPRAADSLVWWAQELYPVVRQWLINNWCYQFNIVICDFPGGTDVVHAVQECNRLRKIAKGYPSGSIYWYRDNGFQTGTGPLSPSVEIGRGSWTDFSSVFASSDGRIYAIEWNGTLRRYIDTHWQQAVPMSLTGSTVISTANWQNYRQVFASSDGWIYAITGTFGYYGTGKLVRWHDTGSGSLGEGQIMDAGWENYRMGFASSNGLIYAVTGNYMNAGTGKLVRYHDSGGDKLGPGTEIDGGWENYRAAFGSSDGRIYAIDSQGKLWRWHDTGANTLGPGTQLADDWSYVRMATATGEGRLYAIRD